MQKPSPTDPALVARSVRRHPAGLVVTALASAAVLTAGLALRYALAGGPVAVPVVAADQVLEELPAVASVPRVALVTRIASDPLAMPKQPRRFGTSAFAPGEFQLPPYVPEARRKPTVVASLEDPPVTATAESAAVMAPARVEADPPAPVAKPTTERHFNAVAIVQSGVLLLDGKRFRLTGIELPAQGSTCTLLDGTSVSCRERGATRLDLFLRHRAVACVLSGDGAKCRAGKTDLAEWLIGEGLARATDRSDIRLAAAESAARQRRIGIWQ